MELYNLKLTKEQLKIVSMACELMARIQIGQVGEIFKYLPLDDNVNYDAVHQIKDILTSYMPSILKEGINGYNSSLSIVGDDVDPSAKIAYETHQTISHRLSWEEAIINKIVESENSTRNHSKMSGVNYDKPLKLSNEPLPEINK